MIEWDEANRVKDSGVLVFTGITISGAIIAPSGSPTTVPKTLELYPLQCPHLW